MSKISDFASNSIMGVVRKIVNHIVDNVDPQLQDTTDHLPARFSGIFNDTTRNLTMTIESQGASAENLVATVNIPAGGGGSGGPTYSAGNGINITDENAIEIDSDVTATVAEVDTKVAKNQGIANAGKVLGIGSDGMVAPVDAGGSGGSTWTKVTQNNISNFKWKIGDIIYGRLYYFYDVGISYEMEFTAIFKNTTNNIHYFISDGYYYEEQGSYYPIGNFRIDSNLIKCNYQQTFGGAFNTSINNSLNSQYTLVYTNAGTS